MLLFFQRDYFKICLVTLGELCSFTRVFPKISTIQECQYCLLHFSCEINVTGASFMTVRTRQLISQSFVFATF